MENTQKNAGVRRRSNTKVRYMTQVGMLSAVATVLMLFEFPLPFVPDFYKIDISEIPVLLGTFAMGPLAGVMTECIKILLNFVINGTTTGGIGELANFLIGCSFCVPAGLIYKDAYEKRRAHRPCDRYCDYGADRMLTQCLCSVADLRGGFWNTAGYACTDGTRTESGD